jgi:hypothetical protein
MVTRAQASDLQTPLIALIGTWVLAVIFTIADNILYFLIALVSAGVACWAAVKSYSSGTPRGGLGRVGPIIGYTIGGLLLPVVSLPVQVVAMRSSPSQKELVPHPQAAAVAEREHRAARVAWERRIAAFEEAEERRVKTADLWYPVTVSERTGLVCAFGGTATGWAVGLFTLGGSLLGSGKRVLIGNLSRRACTNRWLSWPSPVMCGCRLPRSDRARRIDCLPGFPGLISPIFWWRLFTHVSVIRTLPAGNVNLTGQCCATSPSAWRTVNPSAFDASPPRCEWSRDLGEGRTSAPRKRTG